MSTRLVPVRLALLGAALGLVLLGATAPSHAEYLAHAVTEKKGKLPLPEDLSAIAEKRPTDLIQVEWSSFKGKRPRIRVLKTENKTGSGDYSVKRTERDPDGRTYTYTYDVDRDYGNVPIEGLDAMLTDILLQTGRFDVVERESLDEILGEQDLADSGRVSAPSAAKKGKVLGAQLGVKLVVNSYDPDVKGKNRGLGGLSKVLGRRVSRVAGAVNWKTAESRIGITLQLVDLETARIVDSRQVEVTLKAREIGFGGVGWGTAGALGGFMSNYSRTPIGQAMIAAINIGVHHIVKGIGAEPPEGVVADVSGDRVMVTLTDGQVQPGDVVRAVSLGKEIFHPETGELLSREEMEIGRLRITEAKDSFSFAAALDGTDVSGLRAGDRVVSDRIPEPYEHGAPWDL